MAGHTSPHVADLLDGDPSSTHGNELVEAFSIEAFFDDDEPPDAAQVPVPAAIALAWLRRNSSLRSCHRAVAAGFHAEPRFQRWFFSRWFSAGYMLGPWRWVPTPMDPAPVTQKAPSELGHAERHRLQHQRDLPHATAHCECERAGRHRCAADPAAASALSVPSACPL